MLFSLPGAVTFTEHHIRRIRHASIQQDLLVCQMEALYSEEALTVQCFRHLPMHMQLRKRCNLHVPRPAAGRQRASGQVTCVLHLPHDLRSILQLQASRGMMFQEPSFEVLCTPNRLRGCLTFGLTCSVNLWVAPWNKPNKDHSNSFLPNFLAKMVVLLVV